jgi:hypothetical protein
MATFNSVLKEGQLGIGRYELVALHDLMNYSCDMIYSGGVECDSRNFNLASTNPNGHHAHKKLISSRGMRNGSAGALAARVEIQSGIPQFKHE